jgi:hypothetical protein
MTFSRAGRPQQSWTSLHHLGPLEIREDGPRLAAETEVIGNEYSSRSDSCWLAGWGERATAASKVKTLCSLYVGQIVSYDTSYGPNRRGVSGYFANHCASTNVTTAITIPIKMPSKRDFERKSWGAIRIRLILPHVCST